MPPFKFYNGGACFVIVTSNYNPLRNGWLNRCQYNVEAKIKKNEILVEIDKILL